MKTIQVFDPALYCSTGVCGVGTGHTLLLDATGAYHREVTRQMTDKGLPAVTPMMRLQDEKQTKVLLVTLAETTPVHHARRYAVVPLLRAEPVGVPHPLELSRHTATLAGSLKG